MDIFLIFVLIVMNGVFSMSEIAVVFSRKSRLQSWADKGSRAAVTALRLAEEPTSFLSTVQVGITLIGVLSGALGESAIADRVGSLLQGCPELAPYSRSIGLAVMVVGVTYVSLVIGELVPKRLALATPERIAMLAARPMRWLSLAAYPLVKLLSLSTELILLLFGRRTKAGPSVSEDEIKLLLRQGTEEGVFAPGEHELVSNVFRLDVHTVASVMTPRKDIFFIDVDDPPEVTREKLLQTTYSRFPLCQGRFENIIGMVQAKDLFNAQLRGEVLDLPAMCRKPLYVLPSIDLMHLMEEFKKQRAHIALVIDEYGEVEGLVTLQDVMGAIVGDIPGSDLQEEPQYVQREDGSWLVDGMLPFEKFRKLFELPEREATEREDFHTVAGLVLARLGRVPSAADHFMLGGLRIEVVDMDKNRVDKVLVSRTDDAADEANPG
jgi:putative hemolysin